jgi:hypothetical protein
MFVLAALGRLFGGGPLSSAGARASNGRLSVAYERFVRVGAENRIRVQASGARSGGERFELTLARDFFDRQRVQRITPEPADIVMGDRDVVLTFDGAAHEGGAVAVLDVEPRRPGVLTGRFAIADGTWVGLTQFAYF